MKHVWPSTGPNSLKRIFLVFIWSEFSEFGDGFYHNIRVKCWRDEYEFELKILIWSDEILTKILRTMVQNSETVNRTSISKICLLLFFFSKNFDRQNKIKKQIIRTSSFCKMRHAGIEILFPCARSQGYLLVRNNKIFIFIFYFSNCPHSFDKMLRHERLGFDERN